MGPRSGPIVAPELDRTVERNVLTIRADRHPDRRESDEVLASERRMGSFTRQLFLGENLDTSTVSADHRDGVLTVTIPVAETAKPRKVAVGGGEGSPQAIEAKSA